MVSLDPEYASGASPGAWRHAEWGVHWPYPASELLRPTRLPRLFVEEALDVDTAWESFERKAWHGGLDPTGFAARLEQRLPHYERRWEDDLLTHLGLVPKFEQLVRELRRALRAKL